MAESHRTHETITHSTLNGEPSETYHKVHHDLDSAAAKRKPIVTESNYKVTTAEPAGEPEHVKTKTNVSKTSTSSKASQSKSKAQFISKPEYEERDGDDDGEGGAGAWIPLLGGVAAIAAVIGGLLYYKKRNPDVDQRLRRSVEDADHRVKGALGSGERRVKEFLGSGQQRLKSLVGRTAEHIDNEYSSDSDDEHRHGGFGGNSGMYKVKKGDNMSKIAQKTGNKSWHEIAEKNPRFRNPNLIYPGDELRV